MERADLSFPSGDARCAAWLYRPAGEGPHACVVMAGGFGAVRELRLAAYAERFAAAGLAALLFDYRHTGASEGEPRQLIDIRRQLEDWAAAVAFAREMDGVDADRLALWGSSFGGGHVITTAARDPRVAVVVGQVPFVDGREALKVVGLRTVLRGLPAIVRDELRGRRGRPPFYKPIIGPPGSVAAITTPDAEEGLQAMLPEGTAWRNLHAPRIGLRIGRYRPIEAAPLVACPLLLCVAEHDLVTPPRKAIEAAAAAPRGEVRRYPIGHFEIYLGDWFERAVSDQTEFLTRHLLGEPAGAEAAAEGDEPRAEPTTSLPFTREEQRSAARAGGAGSVLARGADKRRQAAASRRR